MKTNSVTRAALVGAVLLCAHYQANAGPREDQTAAIAAQATTSALAQPRCAGAHFAEVRSLRDLPKDVLALLDRNEHGVGTDAVSDRDGPFNATDVGGGPHRRFILAGMNDNCVMAAVEHGGIGYNVRTFVFARIDAQWLGGPAAYLKAAPHSVADLRGR